MKYVLIMYLLMVVISNMKVESKIVVIVKWVYIKKKY